MKNLILNSLILGIFALAACSTPPPPAAVLPIPSDRQMAWQEREMIGFICFTDITFTDVEWGYGDTPPSVFNPTAFDAEQWARVMKKCGMDEMVLTCKHHGGFCLWPSRYTDYSVKSSPWMDGKGDVVKAASDACRKYGMDFGVYLSPWDRNRADYATPAYVAYYRNQLRELLTNYGKISEVWFDGANGGDGYYGGSREMRKIAADYYDWPNTFTIVRELAPDAVMLCGPDIRWCGNESGWVGDPNWDTFAYDSIYAKNDHLKQMEHGFPDGPEWMPTEVNVSIRPGWFYHASEDDKVKTAEQLFQIYLESVGRGSTLLLNVPPDRRGLIHENDISALKAWRALLNRTFAVNLAANAKATADSYRGNAGTYAPKNVLDGKPDTYWATDDGTTQGCLTIDFDKPHTLRYVLIQEYIRLGQRIKAFTVEARQSNSWKEIGKGTTIGYKRILPVEPTETDAIRIRFNDSKACPVISNVELF